MVWGGGAGVGGRTEIWIHVSYTTTRLFLKCFWIVCVRHWADCWRTEDAPSGCAGGVCGP